MLKTIPQTVCLKRENERNEVRHPLFTSGLYTHAHCDGSSQLSTCLYLNEPQSWSGGSTCDSDLETDKASSKLSSTLEAIPLESYTF